MQRRVVTVRPDDELAVAAHVMAWAGVRHLPVVEGGTVIGVLSERDVVRRERTSGPRDSVASAMTTDVQTAGPDDDVSDLSLRMSSAGIGCLPVVEGGQLVGIVTTTDFITRAAREAVQDAEPGSARVRDIMTREPLTANADEPLLDAVSRMSTRGVRHLPVLDPERRVVGMLSDRDVRTAIGDLLHVVHDQALRLRTQQRTVAEIASRAPIVVREDAPLADVVRMLVDHRVGAVPVVDRDGRLAGITSYVDVLARVSELDRDDRRRPAGADQHAPMH